MTFFTIAATRPFRFPRTRAFSAVPALALLLCARYGISLDRVYAHNWIDFKDARYCEGCELATLARQQ